MEAGDSLNIYRKYKGMPSSTELADAVIEGLDNNIDIDTVANKFI